MSKINTETQNVFAATLAAIRRSKAARLAAMTPEQIAAEKAREDREYRQWQRQERQADRIAAGY